MWTKAKGACAAISSDYFCSMIYDRRRTGNAEKRRKRESDSVERRRQHDCNTGNC